MEYSSPCYGDLGGIGAPMNPLFVDQAIALGPTRVMDVPEAGYSTTPYYGLDGRGTSRSFFQPGVWELSGRQFDRNYFEVQPFPHLNGWRDAMEVFTAASFLFPE